MKIPILLVSFVLAVAFSAPRSHAADQPPTEVMLFKSEQMKMPVKLIKNGQYKVQIGRRDRAGSVELHRQDTDVFYILQGSATFVTGGKGVGMKEIQPHEWGGDHITGGAVRILSKGDVIVIPHGIPHQFTKVDGPFLYFVVKITDPSAG